MTTTNANVFQGGENAIANHYDGRAEKYDTHTTFHATLAREYVGFVEPREGERLLDLACGTGLVGFELLSHAPLSVIHGIDISPGMLSIARSKIPPAPAPKPLLHHPIPPPTSPPPQPEITFTQHDITDLSSLPSLSTYDIITICSAFILLPSPLHALKSWFPYLKPGGRIVLDIPHPRSMIGLGIFAKLAKEFDIPVMGASRDWITGTESLEGMMREAGLERIKVFETRIFGDIPAATPLAECGWVVGEDEGELKGAREWDVQVGERVWEEMVKGEGMWRWREGEGTEKKKRRWVEEWEKLATEGKVREEGRLIVGVGYRGVE
ncbi:L-isoaspartate(D-aspartate) O-methyltransferase protein [Rutstroemia sp. NJR-2017a WRK4]|nr:L-isoaspartate(D-aspartate) O-methyltransferase protein [Rutstroemia sp. NJR-2017a WRK4]